METSTQQINLQAAIEYARRGWAVLPLHTPDAAGHCSCGKGDCSSVGKHPRTMNGLKNATTDEAIINQWWTMWPDANVGIVAGEASGLVILDVDSRYGGDDSLEELMDTYGPLPQTAEALTGGGGRHILFRHPGTSIRNSAGRLGPGLDIRADGGYVVAPPSLHASGKNYIWEVSGHPDEMELAEMPEWLLELLTESKRSDRSAITEIGDVIAEGQRNNTLTSLAGTMRNRGMSEASILAALLEENKNRCSPPLDEVEVERIAKSIAGYPPEDMVTDIIAGFDVDQLQGTPYLIKDGRIYYKKRESSADIPVPLCNFVAQVVEEIEKDDGSDEKQKYYVVKGRLATGQGLSTILVPADKFCSLNWVSSWGIGARISAGHNNKDRLREAIQVLSADVLERKIYTHTGWRKINGKWHYLSASGSIPANESVEVELETSLSHYRLPVEDKDGAIETAKQMLYLAKAKIMVPLIAATYLAPLTEFLTSDFTLFLYGETGSLKSTLAALALSHYGDFDRTRLTASWEATANALEKLMFLAKDVPFVIDDFAPAANQRDASNLESKAAKVIRGAGNVSSRARMKQDTTLRESFPPRCLAISTGEQLPSTVSINARLFAVEIEKSLIDIGKLTELQGKSYLLPHAMSQYIEWLAEKINQDSQFVKSLKDKWQEVRNKAQSKATSHMRLPEAIAYLIVGFELYLEFLQEKGVMQAAEVNAWKQIAWTSLMQNAEAQAEQLTAEDPAGRFISVLLELIVQGKISIAPRQEADSFSNWFGNSEAELIGWVDAEYVYLMGEAAYKVVSEFVRKAGSNFPLKQSALYKQLARKGILIPGSGDRLSVSERIGGKTRRVYRLRRDVFDQRDEEESD